MKIEIALAAGVTAPRIDGLSDVGTVSDSLKGMLPSAKMKSTTARPTRFRAEQVMYVDSTDGRRLYAALKGSRDWQHNSQMDEDTFDHKTKKITIVITSHTQVRVYGPPANSSGVRTAVASSSLSAAPMPPKHLATAWVLVYDASTDKYLMLKRAKGTNNPNLWNFPGGGTDGGPPVAGAKRELLEEAGIKIKKSDLIRIVSTMDETIHYFLLILEETPVLRIDPKESSKHQWMTMDEIVAIGKRLHSKTALFVGEKIHRRLVNMAIRKSGVV